MPEEHSRSLSSKQAPNSRMWLSINKNRGRYPSRPTQLTPVEGFVVVVVAASEEVVVVVVHPGRP